MLHNTPWWGSTMFYPSTSPSGSPDGLQLCAHEHLHHRWCAWVRMSLWNKLKRTVVEPYDKHLLWISTTQTSLQKGCTNLYNQELFTFNWKLGVEEASRVWASISNKSKLGCVMNPNAGLLTPEPLHFPGHHSDSLWIIILTTYTFPGGSYYSENAWTFRNGIAGANGKLQWKQTGPSCSMI